MNIGISVRDENSDLPVDQSVIIRTQRELHKAVNSLLMRRRDKQEPKISKYSGQWNKLHHYSVLTPELSDGKFIYRLHNAVELSPKDLKRERQLEHFIELRDMANK